MRGDWHADSLEWSKGKLANPLVVWRLILWQSVGFFGGARGGLCLVPFR